MFGKIGGTELIVILLIVLVIFGPKQLPKLGKTVGKTIKGFRDSVDGVDGEKDEEETI